jgi:hypothetical protein
MPFTAVYDACVLYPAPLRDFLMWLALTDLFKARWTEEIHAEWIRNVLNNRSDLTKEQLTRTKNLMNANVRDSLYQFCMRLRFIHPQAEAWGYTNKAHLRGLIRPLGNVKLLKIRPKQLMNTLIRS